MESIEQPPLQMIMHIPPFKPEDVYYAETFLPFDVIVDMLFLYCSSHITWSYSFFDDLANLRVENEWSMEVELAMIDCLTSMGKVLFYQLAINPVLIPLMVSEVVEVIPIANNAWLIKYTTEGILEVAETFGLSTNAANTVTFNPANVNYPHAVSGDWVSSILS